MATDSTIRVWSLGPDSVTLSYAQLLVHYSPQGELLTDRLGLVHHIRAGCARYPTGLTLRILAEELTLLSDGSQPQSVLAWLEYHFRAQSELVVYARGDTLAEGGAALSRHLAFKGRIIELPAEYFGTLPVVGGGPEYVEMELTVHEDGTFSDFDSLNSWESYAPARPGSGE